MTESGEELVYLSDRNRFRYVSRSDNIRHEVKEGDTLHTLAARFYAGMTQDLGTSRFQIWSPAQLWWVIADYQIEPIVDPTIRLVPGSIIVAPSRRTVREEVFSADRRNE